MTGKSEKPFRGKARLSAVAGLLVAVALLAGGYAWLTRTAPASQAEPPEQITIAINMAYAGSCPVIAAQEKGYFASEGILAVMQSHSTGKAAMDAVMQERANLATVGDIPVMLAGMKDWPVSVIATIFQAEKDHGIVGRRDRGVIAPASLKGKRIGVTLSTSGHFMLHAFLSRYRLSPNEVTIRNYKPEELPIALTKGDIDAIATWEPFLDTSLTALGGNGVIHYSQGIYESLFTIAGMRAYVVSHPETIKKVLRALAKGAQFCSDAPDAARELMAAGMKVDATKLKALWPSYRFNVALDQGLILALEDEARWAIKTKQTSRTEMPNYLNYIDLEGLTAVMPSAVTIIH